MANASIAETGSIEQLRKEREALIDDFRIHGVLNTERATALKANIKDLINESEDKTLALPLALYELATIQRINNEYEAAISTYQRATVISEEIADSELLFDAWLGIARSHAYGTRDHGAAKAAFERAVASAGSNPTNKQSYEIADYSSQLLAGRGELEEALLNALQAIKLAQDGSQRFYAFLDAGDVLQKFAESCDYKKLIDAKTYSEEDSWGACKRAVSAARAYYEEAESQARELGWESLEQQAQGFVSSLEMRLFLINQRSSFEAVGMAEAFKARDVRDVLVNENFSAGGSELDNNVLIAALIDQVVTEEQSKNPRDIYLRGVKADAERNEAKALEYYKRAAKLLSEERSSLFDLRQRGTVIESRTELFRDLGLRLLAKGQREEAFVVFESMRSVGLGVLAEAYDNHTFSEDELQCIADLVQLDSLISATQNALVETTIAGIDHSSSLEILDELNKLKAQRRIAQGTEQAQSAMSKLASVQHVLPTMTELKNIVGDTNIPVMLYWTTPTNVIVWVVGPQAVDVKTVFLPESAVIDKVNKLVKSVRSAVQDFDRESARELYAYLIAPFEKYMVGSQFIIIPQGPLVGLPFEALVDGETDQYLLQKYALSYAPNASFAIKALRRDRADISELTVVYDEQIEGRTGEIAKIQHLGDLRIKAKESEDMNKKRLIESLGKEPNVHVLLHGEYNHDDPLQSFIRISERDRHGDTVTAAELLAIDWKDTNLAVFSSCEGALVKTRISNELFGISWALLAGGVDSVVLSRWRVKEATNADWMEAFYKSLVIDKKSTAAAVNTAMRTVLDNGDQHPHYWAGPQAFGR